MAQISRVYKYELPILLRVLRRHNNQRREHNYYEVLRVPTNATQKQIRDAYIQMSKDFHPDNRKGSHADFVKINEAYNVLSKPKTRSYYDMNLKYNNDNSGESNGYDFKQWETYEMYSTNSKKKIPVEIRQKITKYCTLIVVLGALFHSVLIIYWSKYNMKQALKKSGNIQASYDKILEAQKNKTKAQQVQEFKEKYKNLHPDIKCD